MDNRSAELPDAERLDAGTLSVGPRTGRGGRPGWMRARTTFVSGGRQTIRIDLPPDLPSVMPAGADGGLLGGLPTVRRGSRGVLFGPERARAEATPRPAVGNVECDDCNAGLVSCERS